MQERYINLQYSIGCIRVKYDRVWNRKKYFEIETFLLIEEGLSRAGKFKAHLYFPVTEICLCFNLNFLLLLKIPVWNSKRQVSSNFNIISPIRYPIIYNSQLGTVIYNVDCRDVLHEKKKLMFVVCILSTIVRVRNSSRFLRKLF